MSGIRQVFRQNWVFFSLEPALLCWRFVPGSTVAFQKKREPISTLQQFPCHSRSLTARPWEMVGLEDDPFLLGFCKFSGVFALKLRCWVFSVRTFWWRPATIFAVGLPNQSRLNLARNLAFKGMRINISIVYSIIWTQKNDESQLCKKTNDVNMSIFNLLYVIIFFHVNTHISFGTYLILPFSRPVVSTGRGQLAWGKGQHSEGASWTDFANVAKVVAEEGFRGGGGRDGELETGKLGPSLGKGYIIRWTNRMNQNRMNKLPSYIRDYNKPLLAGGFNCLSFTRKKIGEMIQFDEYFSDGLGWNHQLVFFEKNMLIWLVMKIWHKFIEKNHRTMIQKKGAVIGVN